MPTLISFPIHRHEGNFYRVQGNFNPTIKETPQHYIITKDTRKIPIPKKNTDEIANSLYDYPDDSVFFLILHEDTGKIQLLYIDILKVLEKYVGLYP